MPTGRLLGSGGIGFGRVETRFGGVGVSAVLGDVREWAMKGEVALSFQAACTLRGSETEESDRCGITHCRHLASSAEGR